MVGSLARQLNTVSKEAAVAAAQAGTIDDDAAARAANACGLAADATSLAVEVARQFEGAVTHIIADVSK